MALTFDHRGKRGGVGLDHLAVAPLLAWGELGGLLAHGLVRTPRSGEVLTESCTLRVTPCRRWLKASLGLRPSGRDICTELKERLCGLTTEFATDLRVATTATTKAAHDFGEVLSQACNAVVPTRAAAMALRSHAGDELEGFFEL